MNNKFFHRVFPLSISISIIAALLRINHIDTPYFFIVIGVFATLLFIGIAIFEIATAKKTSITNKIIWVLAFLLLSHFAGIYYFLVGRQKNV